ncbi:sulfotransferase 1B1-like [Ylistrum balloti]|uniref:sulfotransferase 1B1-like n=1 Tax=Ylistrum balloti TaxID=509963 RepID=UPI002905AF58|nr:sulfotransferase 1B1-like [Ylistrum balloti]
MPLKKLPYNDGSTLTVMDLDGFYLTLASNLKNQEEELLSMPDWQARDDDVMICTYPKSGTHMLWEIVCMLMTNKARRIPTSKSDYMMEVIPKASYDNFPSPRVLNTHMYFEYLPKDFAKRKCKIVYIMRNPKDVAVSFFNHHSNIISYNFSGTWGNYVPRYLKGDVDYGTWFDYTLKWEKFMADNPDYPIFMTTFEDMKEDALREVNRLAKFLEVDRGQDFLKEVIDLCHFDRMKKEKNHMEVVGGWRGGTAAMYRKGEVGDWKNWFTVAQNELFDQVCQEKMKYSEVKPRYTL